MGNCISTGRRNTDAEINIKEQITNEELRVILRSALAPQMIQLADREYGLFSLRELRTWLAGDGADNYDYRVESFDCDDFAWVSLGRQREWYRSQIKGPYASTYGVIWGDIRHSARPESPRYHAVNFVVDDKKEVWLIEPQTDELFKLTTGSAVWFVVV